MLKDLAATERADMIGKACDRGKGYSGQLVPRLSCVQVARESRMLCGRPDKAPGLSLTAEWMLGARLWGGEETYGVIYGVFAWVEYLK